MAKKTIPMKVQSALARFKSARSNFEAFRKANPKLVEEYEMLREAYNSALEEFKTTYKDNWEQVGEKIDDFQIRTRTLVDAEKLVQLMGKMADPLVKMEYSVIRTAYDSAVAAGLIPSEVIDEVQSDPKPSVYGPKPL